MDVCIRRKGSDLISLGKLGRGRVFTHDAINNLANGHEITVKFPGVTFVSKYFIDLLLGMTTESITTWEVYGIIIRNRGHSGCQDKSVISIDRGVFFETLMRRITFNCPI